MTPIPLKNLSLSRLHKELAALGEPRFRVEQVLKWIYRKRISTFDEMRNIAKTTISTLMEHFILRKLEPVAIRKSACGDAIKFGFKLIDSDDIAESVLLIDDQRRTACLSSQLGCGLGCTFCATGHQGFVRNLTLEEMVGQLIGINDYLTANNDKLIEHIVFMGMGEALSNFEVFANCCEFINSKACFGLNFKRVTVSTAGVVPSIDRLIKQGPPVNLAISLNAHSDEYRNAIMPINKKYPIRDVVAAGRRFADQTEGSLTFEYVVNHGINDTPEAVNALSQLLAGIPCKVNCIPMNANPEQIGKTPRIEDVKNLTEQLYKRGIIATVRTSRGGDIDGACGQLRFSLRTATMTI